MVLFSFRKRKAEEEVVELPISEVNDFLEKSFGEKLALIQQQARNMHAKTIGEIDALDACIDEFEKTMFGDKKEYAMLNMVKNNFVTKSRSVLGGVPLNLGNVSYTTIRDFHSEMSRILAELKSATPKQAVLLSRYFEQQTAQFIGILKRVEDGIKMLGDFMETNGRGMGKFESIIAETGRIVRERESTGKNVMLLREKSENLEDLRMELKNAEKIFEVWKRGREFEGYEKIRQMAEKIEAEMKETRGAVINTVSFLGGMFKKLQHSTGERFFSAYFESPFETIYADPDGFGRGIDMLTRHIAENKIGLDEKGRERVGNLRSIVSDVFALMGKYRGLESERQQINVDIHKTADKFSGFEIEISLLRKQIGSTEMEIANLMKDSERIRQLVQSKKVGLEKDILELTRKKVILYADL